MKTMTRDVSQLQQEQVERLMQIGAYLRHVREENGLSLEEFAAQTMIQTRMLRAIEEGKLHQLPEPVYVQGFIRRYADALGLDGVEFAEAFPAQKSLNLVQSSWKDSPAAQLRPLHLYIAYVALIIASVSLLSYIVGRSATSIGTNNLRTNSSTQALAPALNQTVGEQTPTPTKIGKMTAKERITTDPTVPNKPVRIDIKLTAQSWLEVETDGEVKLAEVLPEGTERTWTADKQVRVRAGNAGGVLLAYNGGKAAQLGAPGAVEEKTFTPDQSVASTSNSDENEN